MFLFLVPSTEGRRRETSRWRGGMRRPRAGLVTPLPGGPGQPSGLTTRACLEWLDVTRTRDGESRPGRVGANAARRRVGKHGPGD